MALFQFDIRTIILLMIIGDLISAVTLLTYKSSLQSKRPYYHFIIGKFLQSASWILIALRTLIPDLFSVVFGNFFLLSGFAFEAVALISIEKPDRRSEISFAILSVLGALISMLLPNSPAYRILSASFIVAFFYATVTVRLLGGSRNSSLKTVIGMICALFAICLIGRGVYAYLFPDQISMFSPNPVQAFSFLAYFPILFGSGIGFILMIKERDDRQLSESEKKFAEIFISSPNPILLSSLETNEILEVNPSFEVMSGFKAGEIIGKTTDEINIWYSKDDRIAVLRELKEKGRIIGMEYRFKRKSGDMIIGLFSAIVTKLNDREVVLASLYDITARKQSEEKLKMYSEELHRAKVTKEKFFSIIAHDLRSPFQTLLSVSELLSMEVDSLSREEIKKLSEGLNVSLKKQFSLLTDLLDWSKIQSKDFSLNEEPLQISSLVQEVVELLMLTSAEKGISIEVDVPDKTIVLADKNMIKLVVRNLISNSIKFTDRNGTIKISAEKMYDQACISIADNGIGIPASDMNKLFRDDLRFSTPGTKKETGSGLGLPLCKEIIEKHGGKIRAESTEGQGSKFSFTLPIKL